MIRKELGVDLKSCKLTKIIHPLYSARADIICLLFLCEVESTPKSKEQGKWFSVDEVMRLVPMQQNGIVPSHLVAIYLISHLLATPVESPHLRKSRYGYTAFNPEGYSQKILVVDDITSEMVRTF